MRYVIAASNNVVRVRHRLSYSNWHRGRVVATGRGDPKGRRRFIRAVGKAVEDVILSGGGLIPVHILSTIYRVQLMRGDLIVNVGTVQGIERWIDAGGFY